MLTLNDLPSLDGVVTPQDHKERIISWFTEKWSKKYDNGQVEHGGKLWRKQCLPFLVEEMLDFFSYVAVLAPQLLMAAQAADEASTKCTCSARHDIRKVANLLSIGNEEGVPEEDR